MPKVRKLKTLHRAPLRVSTQELVDNPVFADRREAMAGSTGPYFSASTAQGQSIAAKLKKLRAEKSGKGDLPRCPVPGMREEYVHDAWRRSLLRKLDDEKLQYILQETASSYLDFSFSYALLTTHLGDTRTRLPRGVVETSYFAMRDSAERNSQFGLSVMQIALDYLKEKYPKQMVPLEMAYEKRGRKKNAK
jgi:hypothetical protein